MMQCECGAVSWDFRQEVVYEKVSLYRVYTSKSEDCAVLELW